MASTLLSPGVVIQERDATLGNIETVEVNVGAIAGAFTKGPVNKPVRINSESELLSTFGEPNDSNYETWFAASSFLAYGGVLDVVRASGASLKTANKGGVSLTINSVDDYEGNYYDGTAAWDYASRNIGAVGNSIKVVAIDAGASQQLTLNNSLAGGAIAGSLLENTVGTKSAYIHKVDGVKVDIIWVTGGAWGTADIVDDGASPDIPIVAVQDWYDAQTITPTLNWNQVAPRPGTSPYVADRGGSTDEMHIIVVDVDGGVTGTPNTVLEKFLYVSKASDGKSSEGSNVYYPEVIKTTSKYIYWGSHDNELIWDVSGNQLASASNFGGNSTTAFDVLGEKEYELTGGVDDFSLTQAEIIAGYEYFADPETVQIDYLIMGGGGGNETESQAKANKLISIANSRKDCVAYISPDKSNVVGIADSATQTSNIVSFFEGFASSSYVMFDSGWKYLYDRFADKYRWIPCNGDTAGLCAATTAAGDPWFSPAGLNRGGIRNAIKLAYSPKKSERDTLYQKRINPITSLPGQGIVLFGDKTALASPSAFDRINVRRLFLVVEKTIGNAAKGVLFELNDEFTRNNFNNVIEPYLRDIQARRGITDFLVVCDSSNNTSEVVDRNEFVAEIYIKPSRSINFITLTFVATRTGVSFEEVIPRRN